MLILSVEEAIETSLDILDAKYKSMSEVLEKPVFFDSLEVRQVISDIKNCRNAILYIANRLTNDSGIKSESEEEVS